MEKQGFRVIFHIDLNAFFASCEIALRPELRHKPVAVGGGGGNFSRGVVTAANYIARGFGVHSAMPMSQARKKCPKLVVLPGNFDLYRKVSKAFFEILREYSHLVEQGSIDEAYVDVSHHYGKTHPVELAKEIQARVLQELGVGCSIGVAPNKFLAKMASDMKKPNGLTVLRKRDLPQLLWPLPIGALYGIGKASAPKLQLMGIETIGDLANYPDLPRLEQLFGPHVLSWVEKARGNGSSRVAGADENTIASVGHSTTFHQDYFFEEEIKKAIGKMCRQTSNRLKKYGFYAKTVTLQVKYADFRTISRGRSFSVPIRDERDLYQVADELFDEHWEGEPVRLVGVSASNLTTSKKTEKEPLNLFNYHLFAQEEKVNAAIRTLNQKLGSAILKKGIDNDDEKY